MKNSRTADIAVIGAGPAGMMAAISAAERGEIPGAPTRSASVVVIERNGFAGKKLNITGKGRCNLLNFCTPDIVIKNTPRNGKFLYSALNRFPPDQTYRFFEENGLPLKTERGNRVFPLSDKAKDVTDTLKALLKKHRVTVIQARAASLDIEDGRITGIRTDEEAIDCKAVILATGGLSYPGTGSTGDGYRMAAALGHTVIMPKASIVPLVSDDPCCARMQGLSLKNVAVKARNQNDRIVYEDFGEMLFTHYGISGPTVLSMSAHLRDFEANRYTVSIDLKPALDEKKLDERILRDFTLYKNRCFGNALSDLLPAKMIDVVVERTGIPPEKPVHSISKTERLSLLGILKAFTIQITGTRPIDEAVVTSGGIDVREIEPNTMRSRLVPNLFFAGEIIDADAYTGGFNLQIAWSTGRAAGLAAADCLREDQE